MSVSIAADVAPFVNGSLRVLVYGIDVGTVTTITDGVYKFQRMNVGTFTIGQAGQVTIRTEWSADWLNLDRIIVESA